MSGRVLITGGASFLGRGMACRLDSDGWGVRLLDIAPVSAADAARFEYVRADVCDQTAVRRALRDIDVVVHAAFMPPEGQPAALERVNVGGTGTVLDAAENGGARVVMVSSTIVDRPLRRHPVLSHAPQTRLYRYAETRRSAERLAHEASGRGVPVAILRPKTFLGAGAVGAFAILFDFLRRGQDLPLLGSGRNRYQLLDVADFAAAVSVISAAGPTGTFGVGSLDFGTTAADLGELVAHAGTGARVRLLPEPLSRAALRLVEGLGLSPLSEWHQDSARGRDSVVDTGALVAAGWSPTHSNAQALCAAYDWYVAQPAGAAAPTHRVPGAHRGLAAAARLVGRTQHTSI